METQNAQSKISTRKWQSILGSPWLIAFLVPFLIAGTLVTIDFYKHGYHDLEITHNETIREHQPSDVWDCLGYGLFFGGLGGTGAGLLGLGGYACFLVCQKLSASKTIR
jgi:hypothetical protein